KAPQLKSCKASSLLNPLAVYISFTPHLTNKWLSLLVTMILLPRPNQSCFPANAPNCFSSSTSSRTIKTLLLHSVFYIILIPSQTSHVFISLCMRILERSCFCKET
ncbi:hypothetical protein ACB092_05G031500, partial [Castanea dentata]